MELTLKNGIKVLDVPKFLQEIATAFGSIPGIEAVAWCGSAAMGVADAHSDFDFYVYTNVPVAVWIASYTDILFAVNRRYHPGEKRLLMYLKDLPDKPQNALEDVPRLCALAGSLSSPIIEQVSGMLSRLDRWMEMNGA